MNSPVTETAVFRIFVGTLLFCPLAFGAVETWSVLIMEAGIFSALLCLIFAKEQNSHRLLKTPGLIPLGAFLCYTLFQTIPLPPQLIRIISPSASAIYSTSVWTVDPNAWATLSLYPKGTVSEFLRLSCYAGAYLLATHLMADSGRMKKTVAILSIFGTGLAFFSIIQHLTSNGKIYWFRDLTQGGTPFGPYVNRNHFAGLMGMLFPVVMALFLLSRPSSSEASLRRKVSDLLDRSLRNEHLLFGLGAVLVALSIFLSLSRGGILSLCISVALLGFLLRRRSSSGRGSLLLAATVIVILYAVGWFGWTPVFERFRSIRSLQGEISELRLDIWKDSLGLIKDFPITGTGAGSFMQVYPAYRTILIDRTAEHAHNDYVELLADSGIIGTGLFAWFIASVIWGAYRIFLQRKEPVARHLFAGALAGVSAFLLHAITDFNFHINANGLYLFLMLGLVASTARLRSSKEQSLPAAAYGSSVRKVFICTAGGFLAASLLFNTGQALSSILRTEAYGISFSRSSPETLGYFRDTFSRASFLDPLEPSNHYLSARTAVSLSDRQSERSQLLKAQRLAPSNAAYLQAMGSSFDRAGDTLTAAKLYAKSIAFARTDPAIISQYGSFLLGIGEKEDALKQFKTALSIEPAKLREYTAFLVLEGLSDSEILRIIPDDAASRMTFAEYLYSTGSRDKAIDIYRDILSADPKNDTAKKRLNELRGETVKPS